MFNSGENLQLKSVYSHVVQCPKIRDGVICPYNIVGCKAPIENDDGSGAANGGLANHMKKNEEVHAAITVSIVKSLEHR